MESESSRIFLKIPFHELKPNSIAMLIPAKEGYSIIIHSIQNGIIEYEYVKEETKCNQK